MSDDHGLAILPALRRARLPGLLLALVLLPPALPGAQADRDRQELGQALAAYRAGDPDTAIRRLREIHRRNPDDPEIRLYLGLMLYEKDSTLGEARALMASVADRYPGNRELQLKLLDSLLAAGDRKGALARAERLRESLDRDRAFAFQVAYLFVSHGLQEAAEEQLGRISARVQEELQKLPPGDRTSPAARASRRDAAEIDFIRGLAAAGSERKDEALELLQRADRQDFPPRESYQMLMLADSLARLREHRLAAQAYEEYLKHHPDDDAARMRLGDAFYTLGWFEEARACYEQIRKRNPHFPQLDYALAKVLLDLHQVEEAETYAQRSLKTDSACARCLAKLAHIEYLRAHNDECRNLLEKALALDPEWTETHLVYGLLHNRLGRYDLAIESLEKVIRIDPDYPTAHYQLAVAYQRSGRAEKAKEHREIYNRLVAARKR